MHKMKRFLSIVVTVCMLVSILATGVLAINITEKPANGTTVGQPFAPGTGGSANFRIPGLVTLDNGRVVATIDARWSWAADAGGIDTLVSVSDDNGANWTYTFANYLGDNGDVANNQSCCFIDPAIATDGTTLYMIADLYPAGFAINSARYYAQPGSTGFDGNGNLLLRSDSENNITFGANGYETDAKNATYGYYLKDGKIYTTAGAEVEGYTVDAYFNITGNGINTNLFFGDSPYKPFPTDFLYMTTSTDGLTWSEPELLNVKAAEEQSYLVGPGNGTYDAVNGNMVFTAYRHTSGAQGTAYECASLIWMDSEGNWHRSEDATTSSWSSEATSVVLDDGTVRMFYRDGYTSLRYTDFVFDESVNNYVVADREVTTAATVDAGCQLTSILYSEQIDGKDVILVAGPTTSRRINGYIYAFLVNEDNSMELAYAYNVTPDFYAYSCLTELENGDIGLLYESAGSAITFVTYDFEEITNRDNDPRLTFKEFEVLTGDSVTFTDNTGYYAEADTSELDTDIAELTMTGEEIVSDVAQLGTNVNFNGEIIDLSDCAYTFTKGENDRWSASALDGTVHLYPGNTSNAGYPNRGTAYSNLSILEGNEEGTFFIMSNDRDNNSGGSYLLFDNSGLRWDRVSSPAGNAGWLKSCSLMLYKSVEGNGSAEIPGYERVTELSDVVDGDYLVVGPGADGNLYALYPSTSTATRHDQLAKLLGRTTVGHTDITFTGVGAGYTEVQIGSTVYKVTVADKTEVALEIPVGTTVTVTEANGNYENADISKLDQTIASLTMEGIDGTTANGLSTAPVSELTDGTYVIVNTRAQKLVNNTSASAEGGAGSMGGLGLKGNVRDFDAATAIWTFTAVDGGYTIADVNGKYMSIASNAAGLQDTAHTIHVERNGSTWVLEENNAYLNDAGGAGTTASGWQNGSARVDPGSQFDLYTYTEEPYGPSTELTFTGVKAGTTELLIGRTLYKITVTGNAHDVDLIVGGSESILVPGDLTEADTSELDTAVATVEMAPGYIVRPGTGEGYVASYLPLADCLYTFEATDDGYFEVSGTAADGTKVYLNHFSTATSQIPNCNVPGKIDVCSSSHENMFKLVAKNVDGSSDSDRGLHFHTEKEFPHWNRCGNDTSAKCHEYLVRFDANGAPALVTSLDEVVDGGQYLIGHIDNQGKMYVLVPSTSTDDWFAHVGLVDDATIVTFTGVRAGETSLTLPGHTFNITVEAKECAEHDYEAVVTDPTCTEDGYTTYTCKLCGDTYTADVVTATGHAYDDDADATCNNCGEEREIEVIDPNDPWGKSKWVKVEVDTETIYSATEGNFEYAWDGDLDTIWHSNWQGAHDVLTGNNTISGTIDFTKAYKINQFSFTNRQDDTDFPAYITQASLYVKENESDEWICVGEHVEFEATKDQKTFYFEEQNVRYVKFVAEKSSTMDRTNGSGQTQGWVCISEFDINYVPVVPCAHENTEIRNAVKATCTEKGYTGDTYCTDCGDLVKNGEEIPALDHTIVEVEAVEPTCTETGMTAGTKCSVCGEIQSGCEEIEALDHDYVNGDCSRCDAELDPPFEDVPVGSWFFDPVYWAVENKITVGATDTTFDPNGDLLRAQFVTFLYRAAGSPAVKNAENPFKDVHEGDYFYDAVLWAVENKITSGISDDEFGAYAVTNRAQAVTFLWRYKGQPTSTAANNFSDVVAGEWYEAPINWAVENGVTFGMDDGTFGIEGNCNRAQAVSFLYRAIAE